MDRWLAAHRVRNGALASRLLQRAVRLAGACLLLATLAHASEDRAQAPAASERSAGATSADEPPVDAGPKAAPSRATAPPILPGKLAPRSVREADAPIPPSAARARPAPTPRASEPKKARPAGSTPLEIRSIEDAFSARLGSQVASSGGVLGRYDGVMARKLLGDAASFNLVGGFPLAPANDARFDPNRSFYALSLDVAPFDQKLVGQVFGVQQRVDEERERHAVGGEVRFDAGRGFGLATVDYDVDVREVGMVTLLAGAKLDARTTVNAFVDTRRYSSPTVYAALQGQSVESVQQLLEKLAQAEIRAPLLDETGVQTRTLSLGASRSLTSKLELAAGVTLKEVLAEPLGSSMPAMPPDGELDYSLRATWRDFLIARSSTTAGLRIAEMAASRRYAGSLGGQYPLLQNLRVGPDLAFEFGDAEAQRVYKPSLRFEYLQSRLRLDFKLGLEIRDVDPSDASAERRGIFYSIGYRYDF